MIKMAGMQLRILLVLPLAITISVSFAGAQDAAQAFNINDLRSRVASLPSPELTRVARTGSAQECIEKLGAYIKEDPRRPAPWIAYRSLTACAIAAGDKSGAAEFARAGLGLRGSDSDLLVLKSMTVDPQPSEPQVEALTEALVFDRFEAADRLQTLLVLAHSLNEISASARAAALLERWVKREPDAQPILVDTYSKLGNRARALELSTLYLAERPTSVGLMRARARALLLANDRVLNRGDFQEALELLQRIPGKSGSEDVALKANALLKLGRAEDALETLDLSVGPEIDALRDQAKDELASKVASTPIAGKAARSGTAS